MFSYSELNVVSS